MNAGFASRHRGIRAFFSTLLLLLLHVSTLHGQGHQAWSYNLSVYEVNLRQYTPAGTIAAFEPHLDRLQELGVGILWFMPVHPIGQQNRLGSLGSPYSVRDYRAVNPAFGSLEDFKALVEQIHVRGMYVIIDWVANHTAWDHVLTGQHPGWYVKDGSGNFIPPPGTNWSDVIELDYAQQGLRDYMIDAMKFWVEEVGVDGFRFDAVSFVPVAFWAQAAAELKALKPDLFLLAEDQGRVWHDAGFDATYGWGLYGFGHGVLIDIVKGTRTAAALAGFAVTERSQYPPGAYRLYFTSNHDENAWHGTPAELFGGAAEAFAVLTATFHGLPLIYGGQEAGLNKRLAFFDKDVIPWRSHPNAALYGELLHLKRRHPALWNGAAGAPLQRVQTTDNDRVFAFLREKEERRVFVALNLSGQATSVALNGAAYTGSYWDLFAERFLTLDAGAALTLPAWGYVVAYDSSQVSTTVPDDDFPNDEPHVWLDQNAPNPVREATIIHYTLSRSDEVRLVLFDVLGREVRMLASGIHAAGRHEVALDAVDLPSGLYYYRLQAGRYAETRHLVVAR